MTMESMPRITTGGAPSPEAPEEETKQQAAKKPDPGPREGSQKAFDGVRGGHLVGLSLDGCGVALVLREVIEADQVPAGAIEEEAKDLVEESGYGKPFGVLAHRAKEAMEVGEDLDVTQVAAKESQATPAGQRVGGDLDGVKAGRRKLA
jgi:hypothetical protein